VTPDGDGSAALAANAALMQAPSTAAIYEFFKMFSGFVGSDLRPRARRNGILRTRLLCSKIAHMSIARDQVVSIRYTLRDDGGEVIDASGDGEPLTYLHGYGNLIPGLERELTGKNTGDRLQVKIPPAEGYGEYDQALVQRVPRRTLKGIPQIKVGQRLQAQTPEGVRALTVTQLHGDMVTLDANHPLAGKNLNFEVEIAAIRVATQEELEHGHVHGPDDHHH
jgi:FKBP-type peptidyl-prolyl cis-trans isomerase SlyD